MTSTTLRIEHVNWLPATRLTARAEDEEAGGVISSCEISVGRWQDEVLAEHRPAWGKPRPSCGRVVTLHAYPTKAHERAAAAITDFFAARDETDAVLLVNSCARGKATRDSCLDVQVLVPTDAVATVEVSVGNLLV